nr:virulence RhuM family protein [Acholeplasmatales bacterium]
MNEDKKFEIIKFIDGDFFLDTRISPFDETVWLTQKEMALLFEVSTDNIGLHIKNIFRLNELNESVSEYSSVTASDGKNYKTKIYNLDMILAVGYRIKSKRISKFREWALSEIDKLNNINNQKALISQYILFNYDEIKLNVNVDPNEDTVWLNKEQLITLFDTTRQNLEYHINNIYSQNELEECSTCKKILQVQIENNREVTRPTNLYNLDMIISLGYRINSKRGIIFRKWATKILKQYLLKGYVINEERCLNCNSNVLSLNNRVTELEEKMKDIKHDIYLENSKAFYEGEIVEPYTFLRHIFFLAKKEL